MLESVFNNVAGVQACSFIKRYSYTDVNTYFEEHPQKTASICFTSKYYNKYWWQVWARRDLDKVQWKYFFKRNNFIQSNTAI